MTRIEISNEQGTEKIKGLESEMKKLKKQVSKKRDKKLLSCANLFILAIVIIVFGVVCLLYALAISGVVNVPYFTQWFYKEPQPVHFVKYVEFNEKEFLTQLFLQNYNISSYPANVSLSLSEEQLNGFFLSLIGERESLDFAQLAIDEDEFEIYVIFSKSNIVLTLNFLPMASESDITEMNVTKIKVGRLSLPSFLGEYLIEKLIFANFDKVDQFLLKDLAIKSFSIKDGNLILNLLLEQKPDAF